MQGRGKREQGTSGGVRLGRSVAALLVALALLHSVNVSAQSPVTATSAVDRDTVTVGDRIRATVIVTLPADATVDTTELEQQFGDLELLVVGLPTERTTGDRKEVRVGYEVAAFSVGQTSVPPLTVTARLADGTVAAVATAPLPITVQSVIPPGENPTTVRDLKPQIAFPVGGGVSPRTVAYIVAAVAIALAALLLIVRRLRRPRAVIVPLPVAPLSAEARARAELDRIAGLGLLERGEFKELHALLAACVRRYLTDRYDFPAYAMTTTELRRQMTEYGVGRWQGRLVAGLLTESDAVNFAQYKPAYPRCEANLEMAYQIVDAGEPPAAAQPAPAPEPA